MPHKLPFNQITNGINALNTFENEFGNHFFAMVIEKVKQSSTSMIDQNTEVFINRGTFGDHNMPYIVVKDIPYYCQYQRIRNNEGCLTIYLFDRTIDILPNSKDDEMD